MSHPRKPGDLCPLRGSACDHGECETANACRLLDIKPAPAVPVVQSESATRKASPVWSGVLNYFPDALLAVARVSKAGNDKHNPGQPLHWSRGKSNDHLDCAARHLLTPYEIDPDMGELHIAMVAWRALAALQIYLEEPHASH